MESGRHSKKGERKRKRMGKLRKDTNRRKVMEMGRRRRDNEGRVWKEGGKE